jgi:peptide-methionine (S)-S-oxide reductase
VRPAIVRALGGALTASLLAITIPTVRVASAGGPTATAYFAGGCYWGVEAVFRHVRGVKHATSGFAVPVTSGPASADPNAPNYVEAVKVEYDPSQVTYQQLLQVFFLVAHDPTEVNAQGPDIGPEYRSMVFVSDSAQRRAVESYIAELTADKSFPAPIATQVG